MFLNDAEVSLKQAHSFLLKARLCQLRTAFSQNVEKNAGSPHLCKQNKRFCAGCQSGVRGAGFACRIAVLPLRRVIERERTP